MALEAQQVNIVAIEQSWVRGTVGEVTKRAALYLNRGMLIHERAGNLGVAFHADGIACDTAVQPLVLEGAVRIVAVIAVHQSFVYPVMKGLGEERFYVSVAGVAKLWLGYFEETCFCLKGMYAVAAGAAYIRFAMCGTLKIRVVS